MNGPPRALGLALTMLAVAAGSGCLTTNPARGLRANGEPLDVVGQRNIGFRQGNQPIDEQDFYAIAGDKAAVNGIRTKRSTLVVEQLAWQATGLAGIAGIVGGAGIMAGGIVWTSIDGPIGLIALLPGVFLMTGSIVLVPLAYVWADDAAESMTSQTFSTSRAVDTRDRYNSGADRPPRESKRKRRR